MRRKGEDGVAPARAATLITRIVSAALQGRESQAAIDAQVLAQPIILGAQTLPDASATLKAAPGAPLNLTLEPRPSRAKPPAAWTGTLETGAEAKFRGDVAFTKRRLCSAARLGDAQARRRLRPKSPLSPMRSLIAALRYQARWKPRRLDFRDAISS